MGEIQQQGEMMKQAYKRFLLWLLRPVMDGLPRSAELPQIVEAGIAREGDLVFVRSERQLRLEERQSFADVSNALTEKTGITVVMLEPGMKFESIGEKIAAQGGLGDI